VFKPIFFWAQQNLGGTQELGETAPEFSLRRTLHWSCASSFGCKSDFFRI